MKIKIPIVVNITSSVTVCNLKFAISSKMVVKVTNVLGEHHWGDNLITQTTAYNYCGKVNYSKCNLFDRNLVL